MYFDLLIWWECPFMRMLSHGMLRFVPLIRRTLGRFYDRSRNVPHFSYSSGSRRHDRWIVVATNMHTGPPPSWERVYIFIGHNQTINQVNVSTVGEKKNLVDFYPQSSVSLSYCHCSYVVTSLIWHNFTWCILRYFTTTCGCDVFHFSHE